MVESIPGFHEPINAFLHLGAAVVFSVLGIQLLRKNRGDFQRVAMLGVFAFASVIMLSISGVYHMLTSGGSGSEVMLRLDHAAIFVLIAGTFTPIHGLLFRGIVRWVGIVIMWIIAATGVTLVTIFFESMPRGLGTGLYITMGWLASGSLIFVWRRRGFRFIGLVFAGGVAYTAGAILLGIRWPTLIPGIFGPHELWHIMVILGISLHWKFIARLSCDDKACPCDLPTANRVDQ
jgi:channel protein (hemolysin III family)